MPVDRPNTSPSLPADQSRGGHWDVAKWLIPSIGALFIAVGYVAKLSHYSFLGFSPGLLEPNQYVATAADFLQYLLRLPLSNLKVWLHALWDGPHLFTVVPVLLLLAACLLWQWKATSNPAGTRAKRLNFFSFALVLSVVLRLAFLDAPVAMLEGSLIAVANISSGDGEVPPAQRRDLIDVRLSNDAASKAALTRHSAKRAETLWTALLCDRHRSTEADGKTGSMESCKQAHVSNETVTGEGLAHLLVVLVIVLIASLVLREDTRRLFLVVAWLSIFSCISIAAAYGKLGHPLGYEYVQMALETPIDTSADRSEGPQAFHGVVLHTDGDWTTLARAHTLGGCHGRVGIWRISNAQILWQRDIFRTDVVLWGAAKTFNRCLGNVQ